MFDAICFVRLVTTSRSAIGISLEPLPTTSECKLTKTKALCAPDARSYLNMFILVLAFPTAELADA